jgi:hypothetical protein
MDSSMSTSTLTPARTWPLIAALWLLLASSLTSSTAQAQRAAADTPVRAYLSSGVVRLGDRATLIVSVENARVSEIRGLPEVAGLELGPLPEPSERFQYHYDVRSGRQIQSVSRSWAISVRPTAVGEHVVPPLELTVDGNLVRTTELRLNVVADLRGEELGFLEVRPSSRKVVVGQPFSLELVFGFDSAIAEQTNYGNLALSWWGRLPGLLENEVQPTGAARKLKLSLNDRETVDVDAVEPPRELRGRKFVTLRLSRSYTPTRTGVIDFPVSFFEFGEVIERRDFFRTERQKGETYFSRAPEFSIEVVPLPEAGRPVDYSGAIGRLNVVASAQPRDVDAGESIKLRVEWTGEGNLEFFTAPDPARLDAFRDFRVYGKTEEKAFDRRVVVYDLAPLTSQVRAIPPLPLSVYDPQAERYTSVATQPIEIRVRALEGVSGLGAAEGRENFAEDLRDIVAHAESGERHAPLGPLVVFGLGAALPAAWLALRVLVRRSYDPDAPRERARRRAKRQLQKALRKGREPREQLAALNAFLAARTDRTPEAWEGRKAREALPPSQQARAKALEECVEQLDRAVWGGRGGSLDVVQIEKAVDEALAGGL